MGPVRARIETLLASRRLAFVGLSRNPEHFSRKVCAEMRTRGYDIVPVNPEAQEIDGLVAERSVRDITPRVEWALIMTPPNRTLAAVEDCHAAGVRHVWLHQGAGPGSVEPEALAFAERHGLEVVPGECPLMFVENCGLVHRFHALCKRVSGTFPA